MNRDPKEIWLQVNEDREFDEITWAEDSIYDDDVLYIRFDIVAQLEAENKALRANVSKSVLRRLDIQLAAPIKKE